MTNSSSRRGFASLNPVKRLKLTFQLASLHLGIGSVNELCYIVPGKNWIIDWVGHYVVNGVKSQFEFDAQLAASGRWFAGKILHYGSLWALLAELDTPQINRNRVVATIFHGITGDTDYRYGAGLELFLEKQDQVEKLVTGSKIMRRRFVEWGVPAAKIATIPLGIDLARFRPGDAEARKKVRQSLGIPEDAFCIGSFQKDGKGWHEGLEPKLIKGPDVFLEVIDQLRHEYKIHVLLTAPARGFIKRGLKKMGVTYTHQILDRYEDVASMYHALDAYLVASREEGGPSGVLEAMATGVPLVSTRVGLAPDVARQGVDAMISVVDDVKGLASNMARLIESENLREELVANSLERIQHFDWSLIVARYYQQVYLPLMRKEFDNSSRSLW